MVRRSLARERPPFLYHGSPVKLDRLEPRPARGVGPEHDMLTAVYATHDRAVAIAFALGCGPRRGATGFIYTVPADTFEPVDDHQWVSFTPVVPIAVETIKVDDYLHWTCPGQEA